jgi:hypothetical protein
MKFTLFFATMFFYSMALAQDAGPGKFVMGGTFRFSNNSNSFREPVTNAIIESNTRLVNLNPYIGFWLDGNWMVGLQGNISDTKRTQFVPSVNDKVNNTQRQYGIGLFARRYLRAYNGFRVFLETGATYSKGTNKSSNPQVGFGNNVNSQETLAYLSPGIHWAVSKRFNLLARFGRLSFVSGKRKPLFSTDDVPYHYFNAQFNGQTFLLGAELAF